MPTFLYEIPVVLALCTVVNWQLFPDLPGFYGIDPHPYWIVVLLFAVRYGVSAGLCSGIAAAALYLISAWFSPDRYLFADASMYLLPAWFVVVGAAVGAAITQRQQQLRTTIRDGHTTAARATTLAETIETQQQLITHLEERIVTNTSSLISLYEGARVLTAEDEDTLLAGIVRYIATVLGAEAAALYLPHGGGWRVHTTVGWPTTTAYARELPIDAGLIGIAAQQNRVVSLRDFASDAALAAHNTPDALLAGPLPLDTASTALGVLAIQKLPFIKLTSSTITLFRFLLEWATRAVAHSRYVRQLQAEAIIDPQWLVHTAGYLARRGDDEFSRSQRYYLPLSWGYFTLHFTAQHTPTQRQRMRYLLGQLCRNSLRRTDLVARSDDTAIDFQCLWITAAPQQVESQCAAITREFSSVAAAAPDATTAPWPALQCHVSHFTPQCPSFAALCAEARLLNPPT